MGAGRPVSLAEGLGVEAVTIKPNRPTLEDDCRAKIHLETGQVYIDDIAERAIAEGYKEQTERHLTILGRMASAAIREWIKKSPKNSRGAIENLLGSYEWEYSQGGIHHIKRKTTVDEGRGYYDERESYIREINMPDMENFYKELNNLIGAQLPVQFPHITLFTQGEHPKSKTVGISVSSADDLKSLQA